MKPLDAALLITVMAAAPAVRADCDSVRRPRLWWHLPVDGDVIPRDARVWVNSPDAPHVFVDDIELLAAADGTPSFVTGGLTPGAHELRIEFAAGENSRSESVTFSVVDEDAPAPTTDADLLVRAADGTTCENINGACFDVDPQFSVAVDSGAAAVWRLDDGTYLPASRCLPFVHDLSPIGEAPCLTYAAVSYDGEESDDVTVCRRPALATDDAAPSVVDGGCSSTPKPLCAMWLSFLLVLRRRRR